MKFRAVIAGIGVGLLCACSPFEARNIHQKLASTSSSLATQVTPYELILTGALTTPAGSCSPYIASVFDSSGRTLTNLQQQGNLTFATTGAAARLFSDPNCQSILTHGEAIILSGSSASQPIYLRASASGALTLSVISDGLQSGTLPITLTSAVGVRPAVSLLMQGPSKLLENLCAGIVVSTIDSIGQVSVAGSDIPITVSGNASGAFYSDSLCATPLSPASSITIPVNGTSATMYFKDSAAESVTLRAAAPGLLDGLRAIDSFPQLTMTPAAIVSGAVVSADTTNISATGGSVRFSSAGGVGAATFSLISGIGSFNAGTATFTAQGTTGVAFVKVFDTKQNSARATINILQNSALRVSPSQIPTVPVAVSTLLTLTGSSLFGSTVTVGGVNCPIASISADGTSLTCNAAGHAAGMVDVVVTGTYGNSTISSGIEYLPPLQVDHVKSASFPVNVGDPVIQDEPGHGKYGGGTTVSILGLGFYPGTLVLIGGTSCNPTVVSSSLITCLSPAGKVGQVNVVVTVPQITGITAAPQTVTKTNAFNYDAVLGSVNPSSGPVTGGTIITVTADPQSGNGFPAGAPGYPSVKVRGVVCVPVVVSGDRQTLTCTTAPQSPGIGDVVVSISPVQQAVKPLGFTYVPAVLDIRNDATGLPHGPITGNFLVRIRGNGFVDGAKVTIGGEACSEVFLEDSNFIDCRAGAGTVTCINGPDSSNMGSATCALPVIVTNPTGESGLLNGIFKYDPAITSVVPSAGVVGGNTILTLQGIGFATGATVSVGGANCTVQSYDSLNQLTCQTTAHAASTVDITVSNPTAESGTLQSGYKYFAEFTTIQSIAGPSGNMGSMVVLGGYAYIIDPSGVPLNGRIKTVNLSNGAVAALAFNDTDLTTGGGNVPHYAPVNPLSLATNGVDVYVVDRIVSRYSDQFDQIEKLASPAVTGTGNYQLRPITTGFSLLGNMSYDGGTNSLYMMRSGFEKDLSNNQVEINELIKVDLSNGTAVSSRIGAGKDTLCRSMAYCTFMGMAANSSKLYISVEARNDLTVPVSKFILRMDLATNNVGVLTSNISGSGLATDPAGTFLFVAESKSSSNRVIRVDLRTGQYITRYGKLSQDLDTDTSANPPGVLLTDPTNTASFKGPMQSAFFAGGGVYITNGTNSNLRKLF